MPHSAINQWTRISVIQKRKEKGNINKSNNELRINECSLMKWQAKKIKLEWRMKVEFELVKLAKKD